MTGNKPRVLIELAPQDVSYVMDLLHQDWGRQVMAHTLVADKAQPHDEHVRAWRKNRATRILNYIDDCGWKQGFYEDDKGL